VRQQGAKLEKLADLLIDVDRRLIRLETTFDVLLRRPSVSSSATSLIHDPDPSC
jgi:hypothetical protein